MLWRYRSSNLKFILVSAFEGIQNIRYDANSVTNIANQGSIYHGEAYRKRSRVGAWVARLEKQIAQKLEIRRISVIGREAVIRDNLCMYITSQELMTISGVRLTT